MVATRRQVLRRTTAATTAAPLAVPAKQMAKEAPVLPLFSDLTREWFATGDTPALSVAVARACGLVHIEALGYASIELGVAATPEHSFPLGSVSKVLTATAAARLVSRGIIDLDRPIADQMDDLPPHHRATTLRQLLTHQGGVRHFDRKDHDPDGPGGAVYMRTYPEDRDVLALFIDDPLVGPPGRQVHYSSYGFTLASMVMQRAAGVDFCTLIATEIGEPFQLASLVAEDPWAIIPNRASRYLNQADLGILYAGLPARSQPRLTNGFANMPMSNPAYSRAGAGFLMTPSDAASFGAAMLPGSTSRITGPERSLLFTPVTGRTPQSPPLGLAWRIDTDGKGRLRWRHEGATPGGRFALAIYPELSLSIALAGNVMAMRLDVARAAERLADASAECG